ncbi:MAG: hypothetical protein ABIT23_02755 [Nitrosospira sp.]
MDGSSYAIVRQLVFTWTAARKTGDVETVLSLMADEVVFLVPDQPVMRKADFAAAARAQSGREAPQFDGRSEIQDIAYAIGKHTRDEFQWKASAADGNDTVCTLSEKRGEIGCLDSDLHRTGVVSACMSSPSCCGIWSTWNELCRF